MSTSTIYHRPQSKRLIPLAELLGVKKVKLGPQHKKIQQLILDQEEVFLEFIEAETGIHKGTANRLMCDIAIVTSDWTPYMAYQCSRCSEIAAMDLKDGAQIAMYGSVAACCPECATVQNITARHTHISWKKVPKE